MSGDDYEFDIILSNGSRVGLIEVKYKAHPDEIHELVKYKVKNFRKRFSEYENHKLYFGIASAITNPAMINEGIFLLSQKGKHIEIVNSNVHHFRVFNPFSHKLWQY